MKKIAFTMSLFILMGSSLFFAQAEDPVYLVSKFKESFDGRQGYLVRTSITRITPFFDPIHRVIILSAMESCEELVEKSGRSNEKDLDFVGVRCAEEDGVYRKMFQKEITGEWYLGFWTRSAENATVQRRSPL